MDDLGTGLGGLVLQRLPLGRGVTVRDLYLRAAPGTFPVRARVEEGRLRLEDGAEVSGDTYFGAFFEPAWRGPTGLGSLEVVVRGSGAAALRLFRREASGRTALLHEETRRLEEGGPVAVPKPLIEAGAGRVFVELVAGEGGCVVEEIGWRTPDTPAQPVGLVPVFCTFGREAQLGEALAGLASEPDAWASLPRIVVVNQGRPGLAGHPALAGLPRGFRARLEVIEQGNFGGSGGFARGLLAARAVPGATHALLMDDDVATEPEALRRTVAFFAIAKPRVALGGHMLDMLRPTDLHEAGARVDGERLYLRPELYRRPLVGRRGLDALIRPPPIHYNGWWFFGLPLEVLEEVGMPLPVFIRGDDVEYGLRLHRRGIPTVTVPGVAIWHEPFYAKLHGWQGYYDLRNGLAYASLHLPRPARAFALLLAKRLLEHLLAYRYYDAELTLRAGRDWLRGPEVLDGDPAALHAGIAGLRREYPARTLPPGMVAEDHAVPRDPWGRVGHAGRLARVIWRNATVATGEAAPRRVTGRDYVWFRIAGADAVAVDDGEEAVLPVFVRDRALFRRLAAEGAGLVREVLRDGDAAQRAWRAAEGRLTSVENWERLLGVGAAEVPPSAEAVPVSVPPGDR